MTISRRRFAATGVAVALALTLGACTPGDEATNSKSVQIEGTTPLTVQDGATWAAKVLEGAPVRVTSLGVLTFSADESEAGKTYAPVLLSSKDGSARWTGEPIKSETMPALEWVTDGDDRWAVAKTVSGNAVSLYVWNGLASHSESGLVSSNVFEGKKKPPRVAFSGSGVLVSGADKTAAEPLMFWPKDAETTKYKKGPERNGKPGSPVGVYDRGWLVTFPGGGFSYASDSGGWTSSSVAPEEVNPQTGTILAQGHGYVISQWERPSDRKDGSTVLAVHSATSGRLFAEYEVPKGEAEIIAAQKDDGAAVVVDGSRWLMWGQIGFNLRSGDGALYNLEQGVPTAIIDNMLYLRDAYTLIEGPEAEPSDGGGASDSGNASDGGGETASASPPPPAEATMDPDAPKGFSGVTGVDLVTTQPLPGLPSMYPIGRTSTGQVILRDDTKQSIYSVSLR